MRKRLVLLFAAFAFCMGLLCMQLIVINMNPSIAQAAAVKTNKSTLIGETRGMIYDCNGLPLVNEKSERIAVCKPTQTALAHAKPHLKEPNDRKLTEAVSRGEVIQAAAEDAVQRDDVKTVGRVKRYQDSGTAVHLIGYTDRDKKGVCGLEKAYDALLSQASGKLWARCAVDARGHVLDGAPLMLDSQNYRSERGIQVTLDKRVQNCCEAALRAFQVEKGAVVVLDAATAEIRAMASVPVFNQNVPQESLQAPDAPFLNRAVTPYSVGSVFKAVVAAAALEKGIDEDFAYTCTGEVHIGDTVFHCHNRGGHGVQTMRDAMANSCNPYFIALFAAAGKTQVCSMAENLGLGTAIELADRFYTAAGLSPSAEELHSAQDEANLAFGQGRLLASPLQMAAAYTAIANAGVYRAPSLMHAILDENGAAEQKAFLPMPRRAMSEQTAERVRALLQYTVEHGSCRRAKPEHFTAAGKSGTAQSGWKTENGQEICHAWFCGFVPAEQPKYVITVLKEDGKGGSLDCAPIFKSIAEQILKP